MVIVLPEISENIRANLEKYSKTFNYSDPFSDKLNNYCAPKKFGNQVYQGQLD